MVREDFAVGIGARGALAHRTWVDQFADYREKNVELATEIEQMQRRELPANWNRNLLVFPEDPVGLAGRESSSRVLNVLAQNIPRLIGGSVDLGLSNRTLLTYPGAGDTHAKTPEARICTSAFGNILWVRS